VARAERTRPFPLSPCGRGSFFAEREKWARGLLSLLQHRRRLHRLSRPLTRSLRSRPLPQGERRLVLASNRMRSS
jgi:hypothetical protein